MKFKDTLFEFKIASLMCAGIGFILWLTIYTEAKLKPDIQYHIWEYPFGYWRLLIIAILFSAIYCFSIFDAAWYKKILFAEIGLAVVGIISLFLLSDFPHWNMFSWILYYGLASMIAYFIHYTPVKSDYASQHDIPDTKKIESAKESINLWRTLIVALIVGSLVLVLQWCRIACYNYELEGLFLLSAKEKLHFALLYSSEIVLFSLFMLFGPIQECLKKIAEAKSNIQEVTQAS